ncbi:MAG TPA: ABC transporter ATP-binding protein, partial [Rhizomicrobium sp.]|nr:ABC transporter ATP-binding protein [Rhizomicrobium sp.]
MGVESVSAKPRDLFSSAQIFVQDFASIAGRRGATAAALILLAALLEGASISLLVPLLGLIFGTTAMPGWLRDGAAALFAFFGAHTLFFRLSLLMAVFGMLVLLRAIAVAARDITIFDLQFHFVETQQLRTARSLASAKWDYLARFQHARLTHLMSGDMQRLGQGTQFVLLGATASVMVAAQWMLAFLLAPALAAILLAAMIVGAIAFGPMMARARALGGHVEDASLSLLNSTTQFLGGLKLAISQDLQKGYVDETGSILRQLRRHQVHFLKQRVISQAAITLLFGLFGAGAVMVGLLAIKVPASLLVALLLIVTRMTAPMGQIQQAAQQFARLLAVYDTIRELQSELALFARDDEMPGEGVCPAGPIVLEKASLIHTGRSGLRSIDLVIEPGECVAITGVSGAGKTTLADLLVGLYPPQSGRIAAGGTALEGAALMAWRRSLAYV